MASFIQELEEDLRRRALLKRKNNINSEEDNFVLKQRAMKKVPTLRSKEEENIAEIINTSNFPISRKEAIKEHNKEQVRSYKNSNINKKVEEEKEKEDDDKKDKPKEGMFSGKKLDKAAEALSKTDNKGASNIVGGAAAGNAIAPGGPGAIAGATLGVLQNLSDKKKKKKELIAKAILGRSEAMERASEAERDALSNILEGFRSALIF